jgi:hypothetical protein
MPPDYGRFQGLETGIQPEGCRSDGSSQAIPQAVTDGWLVARPEHGQLVFLRFDWSISASADLALIEKTHQSLLNCRFVIRARLRKICKG